MDMDIVSYLMYLTTSIVLLLIFSMLYVILTPYDELELIRQGNGAACLGLSGTLVGFSLTLAASAIYNSSLWIFIAWAGIAMVLQLIGFVCMLKVIGDVPQKMKQNNMAVGGVIGLTGLTLGIINAGCLS